ncbi:receptor-like protein 18 [Camellia sinensis]|uniref:receptor-like protein 18 n=1 Tax=Camellia sinensis TaxID=4442 RepID=UPI001036B777|nr:receptor-like protein 18 [Camellia sinensis]
MLQELDISHNGLQGVLPRSLANCTNLEILNLGPNFIEDAFPFWWENLPQLEVAVLRYNKFHGPIEQPRKRLAFTDLHIIDISHNDFTGTLPSKYFDSWDSMMMVNEDKAQSKYIAIYDYYSVTIMNKGYEMEYVKILTIFKVVDFSHNKFHGKIPISIGRLTAVSVLNFSGNGFTGLCGFPLSKECKTPMVAESPSLPSSSSHNYKCKLDGFGWEAMSMGYGCGAVFGLVIRSCIIRRKEEWLVRIFRVKMRHQKNRSNVVRHQYAPR